MIKQKYKYTLSIDFEACDDIEAREYTQCVSLNVNNVLNSIGQLEKVEKLQRIYANKPPEKVELI